MNNQSAGRPARVSPRKHPTQHRSRSTVKRILAAAEEVLVERGADALTTRGIAAASGVTVGSIYQYFPNKQVIIYTLYRERLVRIKALFERFSEPDRLELPWVRFFRDLHTAIQDRAWFDIAGLELESAVNRDPELQKVGREHLDEIAAYYVRFFRHYGSLWSEQRLTLLANYLLSFDDWGSRQQIGREAQEQQAVQDWARGMREELIAQCIGQGTPGERRPLY